MVIIRAAESTKNCTEDGRGFQHDFVSQEIFDFRNPRTWEVVESKGFERPFGALGTWEGAENKAVVGNVCNRNFHGDKLPLYKAGFCTIFRLRQPAERETECAHGKKL